MQSDISSLKRKERKEVCLIQPIQKTMEVIETHSILFKINSKYWNTIQKGKSFRSL